MEKEQYQEEIAKLEQQLAVKEEIIQEFFTNRTEWKVKNGKLEQRLKDSEQLIATYQEIQKTHEKHRFMYWFLLKLACETVLNTEKSQEEKEDFAKEILTAFEEDFKKEEE